jgi:hypothetical protein
VPDLSDYDYIINLDDPNVAGVELVTSSDFDTLFSSAIVIYSSTTNKQSIANSTDYAGLSDATSAAAYHDRTIVVQGGQLESAALAGPAGAVYVNAKKGLAYYMRGPLVVKGTIKKKDHTTIPVARVRAGKRIKIANFAADIGDTHGAGLTFLISRTTYNDEKNTVSITCGLPDNLALYLARRSLMSDQ